MDEREALGNLSALVARAGDDAAIADGLVFTIDMLHERTDFPVGTSRYTAGWRAVGASLSDIAAMAGSPLASVAAYGAPTFEAAELEDFVRGAQDVCELVGAEYVGGDLDAHQEFTVATAVVGRAADPVTRSGATPGERVFVTGVFGRTAAALDRFEAGDDETGNELLRFTPRVATGRAVADAATAMIDSSDGLARSLHELAGASDCGFAIDRSAIPVDPSLPGDDDRAIYYGEDFELVFTAPSEAIDALETDTKITEIGRTTDGDVTMDGSPLADRGYTHTGV